MRYLVDANVLSEATKPRPDARVLEWLGRHAPEVVVNPIVLGEIEYGILRLSAGRKRERLREWFAGGVRHLPVLEIDADTGRAWAALLAELKRKGRAMPIKDSLVAATALQYGLAVATRNAVDFANAGLEVIDPFAP